MGVALRPLLSQSHVVFDTESHNKVLSLLTVVVLSMLHLCILTVSCSNACS